MLVVKGDVGVSGGESGKLTPKRRRRKTPTSTFLRDPVASIMSHIGQLVDKVNITPTIHDLADLGLMALIGYKGYQIAKEDGAIIAMLGYKLALVTGPGTPPISNIAGLSILAGMGLLSIGTPNLAAQLQALTRGMTPEERKAYVQALPPIAPPPPFIPQPKGGRWVFIDGVGSVWLPDDLEEKIEEKSWPWAWTDIIPHG